MNHQKLLHRIIPRLLAKSGFLLQQSPSLRLKAAHYEQRIWWSRRHLTTTTVTSNTINNNTTTDEENTTEEDRFPLPDPEKEKELRLKQTRVQELYQVGDYENALEAAQDHLSSTQDHFGRIHPATASAYNNTGLLNKQLGNYAESREQYEAARSIYAATVGNDHSSYASSLHNLGVLAYAQVHLDESLSMEERLDKLHQALQHLEEATAIRSDELGAEHSHTVASRSSLGAALAARVLRQALLTNDEEDSSSSTTIQMPAVSDEAWDVAEGHLRNALDTAIQNPRGRRMKSNNNNNTQGAKKKKKTKRKKRDEGTSLRDKNENNDNIQTLSAAAAGQNLAIFLKARGTTATRRTMDNKDALLDEALTLYRRVLIVRKSLLSNALHPDILATQHSLAELLDARGDTEAAQSIRQTLMEETGTSTDSN